MSRPRVTDKQLGFAHGLNTTADPSQLRQGEMRRATNARLTQFGGVVKRNGSQRTHASAIVASATVQGGIFWTHGNKEIAVVTGGVVYSTFSTSMAWTSVAATNTLHATNIPSFAEFYDGSANALYIADGSHKLNKVVGATLTVSLASTPTGVAYITVYNQRLFGITGTDETLYWSELNEGDTLGVTASGGGSAIVRTFGDQKIISLLPVGNSLALLHEQGISVFTGWSQDDFNIAAGTRGLTSDVGTTAPHTCVVAENVGYFLSTRGVYALTESGVTEISQPIASVINGLDASLLTRARAVVNRYQHEVWFYLPDVGVYVWNYRLNAWTGPWDTMFTTTTCRAMWESFGAQTAVGDTWNGTTWGGGYWSATASTRSGTPIVLVGGTDGFVRHVDKDGAYKDDLLSDTTGGSTVQMTVQCRRFFFGDPPADVALRYIYLTGDLGGSSTLAVSWTGTDGSDSIAVPTSTGAKTLRLHAWGHGGSQDISLADDSDSANPLISFVEAEGFSYGRGRF